MSPWQESPQLAKPQLPKVCIAFVAKPRRASAPQGTVHHKSITKHGAHHITTPIHTSIHVQEHTRHCSHAAIIPPACTILPVLHPCGAAAHQLLHWCESER